MKDLKFLDFHCHPNLKTFGHSFSRRNQRKSHLWHYEPPGISSKIINALTGLSKFTQADFTSMSKGRVKIAFVSLYPFEKGFFLNPSINNNVAAAAANLITGIGYQRVRHIQNHNDYFLDLNNEYSHLLRGCKGKKVDGLDRSWKFVSDWSDVQKILNVEECIACIPTIEGAHVFNTGLEPYGRNTDEEEVLAHVDDLKKWRHPPMFMTFAHNFNNDLCGHASSLEKLGSFVNQKQNLNGGFTKLGLKVFRKMLDRDNGKPIFPDLKHMSIDGRLTIYDLMRTEYNNSVPIMISHGAVTGCCLNSKASSRENSIFCNDDINFYDEEIVSMAATSGIFALQMDGNRLAQKKYLNKTLRSVLSPQARKESGYIIWRHLQHIAEVLDQAGFDSWDYTSIGSDFDGTINPLNGFWSAEYFPSMAEELLIQADRYLKGSNKLIHQSNKEITPEEIVDRFAFTNGINYLRKYY